MMVMAARAVGRAVVAGRFVMMDLRLMMPVRVGLRDVMAMVGLGATGIMSLMKSVGPLHLLKVGIEQGLKLRMQHQRHLQRAQVGHG